MKKKPWFVGAALVLSLCAGAQAHAQADDVDVAFYTGADLVPAAGKLVTERYSTDERQALKAAGVVLLAYPSWLTNKCAVDVGYTLPARGAFRAPYDKAWAVSSQRTGEARSATCERAFAAALENLRRNDDLPQIIKNASGANAPQPDRRTPRNLPPSVRTAYTYSSGLNDSTSEAMADLLGDRFTKTFDYRKFAAYVDVMPFKTVEGKSGCMMRTGLTARVADGSRYQVPTTLYTRSIENSPGDAQCPMGLLKAAISDMTSDALSEDVYQAFLKSAAELGLKYPSRKELLAVQAAWERKEDRRHAEAETDKRKAAPVQSRTVSRNVLRCTNECFNGSCIRTFEDGRKERWQAPRVFRFGNWEWDTTTNACGA